jgi:hypothetical protein
MNVRKRLTTTLGLSVSAIGLVATLTMAVAWQGGRIQTVSAKEPRPPAEHGIATPFSTHIVVPEPQAPLEILTDRCSTSVRIEPSLIFNPDQGSMVPGNQAPIRLKRPANKNAFTPFSDIRPVGLTSSGRFAWFCGSKANNQGGTLEHSNCPSGTNAMRARLGPGRLLQIQCLPN